MNEALVLVAKLGRTVGVQGFVRLHNLSDFPEQFECGASFFDKNSRVLKIKARNAQSVLFEGFESLESAKTLVNLDLFQSVEKSRASCKLGDDEFFYFDIIGLEVFENGLLLGVVKDILPAGNDLLLIKSDESLVKKGFASEFYLPYVDFYVKSVELGAKDSEKSVDLQSTNLKNENLQGVNSKKANSQSANSKKADLQSANSKNTSLRGANSSVNLKDFALKSTNLKGANSKRTDLKNANLNAGKIEAQNALMLLESL